MPHLTLTNSGTDRIKVTVSPPPISPPKKTFTVPANAKGTKLKYADGVIVTVTVTAKSGVGKSRK